MRTYNNPFLAIRETKTTMVFKSESFHLAVERSGRVQILNSVLGKGIPVAQFIVDKGHAEGEERHIIHHNGVILVANERKCEKVTMFACRPNYIARYWRALNRRIPTELEYLLETAKRNVMLGLHELK